MRIKVKMPSTTTKNPKNKTKKAVRSYDKREIVCRFANRESSLDVCSSQIRRTKENNEEQEGGRTRVPNCLILCHTLFL